MAGRVAANDACSSLLSRQYSVGSIHRFSTEQADRSSAQMQSALAPIGNSLADGRIFSHPAHSNF
jgi:hypothetical protein